MFRDAGVAVRVTLLCPNVGGRRRVDGRQGVWCHTSKMSHFLLVALVSLSTLSSVVTGEARSPRVVDTRQGKLRGIIRPLPNKNLRPVEVFLGVPYATPPTGPNRFSPTRAARPWEGEREARQYGPVCPQLLPDLDKPTIPRERLLTVQKLVNYLSNQAEDCLYLNVYVPSQGELSNIYGSLSYDLLLLNL